MRANSEAIIAGFGELAAGLNALGERVSAGKAEVLAAKLVAYMGEASLDQIHNLSLGLSALAAQVSTSRIDAAAQTLKDRHILETGVLPFGSKVSARQATELATELVDNWRKGADLEALTALRLAVLTPEQLIRISRLEPDAVCSAVLHLDRTSLPSELLKRIYNPACGEDNWRRLILRLAEFNGKPFAVGDFSTPDRIEVDFPELYDFLASRQSWYHRWKLTLPKAASLLLLLVSMTSFIWGLFKSSNPILRGI